MENRELGENPKRTHHCKTERTHMPLGNWEGAISVDVEPGDLPVIESMDDGKVHYPRDKFIHMDKLTLR